MKPLEINPDDSAEEVDDDEDRDEDDDQVTRVGDNSSRCVNVRHNRPTQLVPMKTKLLPVPPKSPAITSVIAITDQRCPT